jgi:hypothetical protein
MGLPLQRARRLMPAGAQVATVGLDMKAYVWSVPASVSQFDSTTHITAVFSAT